jgi:hypothetical protein
MKLTPTDIPGVVIVEPAVFSDERGWFMDRQTPPASIHLTVHAGHEARIDEFLHDLDECILEIEGRTGSVGSYATTD